MTYNVIILSRKEMEQYLSELKKEAKYIENADINGCNISLITNNELFRRMWCDNFYPMMRSIKPHGTVFAINNGGEFGVYYEPKSNTVLILNCNYYGWVKSIALALVADILEDAFLCFKQYSVHGSLLDVDGEGIAIVGASGAGKTTLTFGMLKHDDVKYISDDWFFVRFGQSITAYSSERNSYIRNDLHEVWKEYAPIVQQADFDNKGRAIVNFSGFFGRDKILTQTKLSKLILLKRDHSDNRKLYKMMPEEAFNYLKSIDYGNPHQLIRNKNKIEMRDKFFIELTKNLPVYMLNTTETQYQSLERLYKLSRPLTLANNTY